MRTLGWSFNIFICLAVKIVKVCWICDVLNECLAEVLRWFIGKVSYKSEGVRFLEDNMTSIKLNTC